eukprot:tig00000692_g3247.t1
MPAGAAVSYAPAPPKPSVAHADEHPCTSRNMQAADRNMRPQRHEAQSTNGRPLSAPRERPMTAAMSTAERPYSPLLGGSRPSTGKSAKARPGSAKRPATAAGQPRAASGVVPASLLERRGPRGGGLRGVGYSVNVGGGRFGRKAAQAERKVILHGINAHVRSGECMAIMGPSGSGKSTLLDIVAGRKNLGRISGRILLNGEELVTEEAKNVRLLQRATSYVTQEDVLLEHLTVRETLMYSARLTLPASRSDAERAARVDELLAQLGLLKAAATKVGGSFVRGVSGGEKRRVSIGVELIRSPNVLILDEPTSGLSSADAYGVVELLKSMAARGHTVLCTIHQPSRTVFSMFDSLLLLARGRTTYFGPVAAAVAHLAWLLIEAVSPPIGSAALALREPAGGDAEAPGEAHAALERKLERLAAEYAASPLGAPAAAALRAIAHPEVPAPPRPARPARPAPPRAWRAEAQAKSVPAGLSGTLRDDACGFLRQTAILCDRNLKLLARDGNLFLGIMAQGILLGTIAGSLFKSNGSTADQTEMLKWQGLFMVCLLITYSSFSSIEAIIAERLMVNRETQSGSYSVASYFLAKTLVSVPQNCLVLVPFAMIMYAFLGFNTDPNVAASCTELFSAMARNASMAIIISNALVGVSFMFGGFFVPRHLVPSYWLWIYYGSFFTYGFSASMVNEFEGRAIAAGQPRALELYVLDHGTGVGDKWFDLGLLVRAGRGGTGRQVLFWLLLRASTMLALAKLNKGPR